jgi:hypothetical protein
MILHRWDKPAPKDPDLDATNAHYHPDISRTETVIAAIGFGLFIALMLVIGALG